MKKSLENRIIEEVRQKQIASKSPVEPTSIRIPNYKDVPRAMRKLAETNKLYRTKDGRYYVPSLKRINAITKWC